MGETRFLSIFEIYLQFFPFQWQGQFSVIVTGMEMVDRNISGAILAAKRRSVGANGWYQPWRYSSTSRRVLTLAVMCQCQKYGAWKTSNQAPNDQVMTTPALD